MDLEYNFEAPPPLDESGGVAPIKAGKPRKGSSGSGKSFACPTCGGQFSRQAILNEHIRAEHLQERVKCTICGMPFKRQNDRRRHETFQHLRKRAFQCKNGDFGCGKRFTRMDSLREHQANPKKAGTTCEQAMLFARAAPTHPPQQQQQQHQPAASLPPLPAPLPPASSAAQHPSLQKACSSEPEPYMTIMPRVDARSSSVDHPAAHELVDPAGLSPSVAGLSPSLTGLSPSVASDSHALTITSHERQQQHPHQHPHPHPQLQQHPQQHKNWLGWQMELPPQKRLHDPSMMPANISWPSIPESRLRHTATDLAACISASLSSVQEMPPVQCLVAQQDLLWDAPDATMFEEAGMWGSTWNWLRADESRDGPQ